MIPARLLEPLPVLSDEAPTVKNCSSRTSCSTPCSPGWNRPPVDLAAGPTVGPRRWELSTALHYAPRVGGMRPT